MPLLGGPMGGKRDHSRDVCCWVSAIRSVGVLEWKGAAAANGYNEKRYAS